MAAATAQENDRSRRNGLIRELLTSLGAREQGHRRCASLFDHLVATAEILSRWSQPDYICLAGGLHSIYGTEFYQRRLVSIGRREEIADLAGPRAERLAYLFCIVRREMLSGAVRDGIPVSRCSIGGQSIDPDDIAALLLMHMANLVAQVTLGESRTGLAQILEWGRSLRRGRDTIPQFVDMAPHLTPEQEFELSGLYKTGCAHLYEKSLRQAATCFTSIASICPCLAEPSIWLSYLALEANRHEEAALHAARGKILLGCWGIPWDKSLSMGQWGRLATTIASANRTINGSELPLPNSDGLPTFVFRLTKVLTARKVILQGSIDAPTPIVTPQDEVSAHKDLHPRFLAYLTRLLSAAKPGSGIRYPGLRAAPWHDTSTFPIVAALERNFSVLKEEVLSISAFQAENEPIGRTGSWDVAFLYECGIRQKETCARCPTLVDIIETFPTVRTLGGLIYISRLAPGTTIRPHKASSSIRLRCHLAIDVPQTGCGISVGGEAHSWEEGKCLVFDDGFNHHAWNRSTQNRIVVVIDIWHPDLSRAEIESLAGLHNYASSQAEWLSGYRAANARARIRADEQR